MNLPRTSRICLPVLCGMMFSCAPGPDKGPVARLPVSAGGNPPVAFIFVNKTYRASSLHPSIEKSSEASSLMFYLKTYGGFDIREYTIRTKAGFDQYLNSDFQDAIAGRSRILVYYVGHGYGLEHDDSYEDFLIPTDANLGKPNKTHISDVSFRKLEKECVWTRDFIYRVEKMMDGSQFCSFHFNACRGSAKPGAPIRQERPKNRPNYGRNISVVYSTLDGRVSYQGHGDRTLYTHAFVSGMAATEDAVNTGRLYPVSRNYYHYRHFHDIVSGLMALGGSRQALDIMDGSGGNPMEYSTGNLSWDQYKDWREISRGNLKDTAKKLSDVTNAMGYGFVRKKPEDAFGNQGYVIQDLAPAALDLMLDHLHGNLVVRKVPPETFFGGEFARVAKKETGLWVSDEKFLLICDLVVPGTRDHLLRPLPENATVSEGSTGDTVEATAQTSGGLLAAAITTPTGAQ
jgi:hypothetical protein